MGKIKKPFKSPSKHFLVHEASPVSTQQEQPMFSFKYLDQGRHSLSVCTKEEKAALAETLVKLSQLTWAQITNSPRHGSGYEKIVRESIRAPIPKHLVEDVNFIAFRFCGKAPPWWAIVKMKFFTFYGWTVTLLCIIMVKRLDYSFQVPKVLKKFDSLGNRREVRTGSLSTDCQSLSISY